MSFISSIILILFGIAIKKSWVTNINEYWTKKWKFFLISGIIGYYPWIEQDDKDDMKELKDTSATKEPILESPYYKQYLKMVNKKR